MGSKEIEEIEHDLDMAENTLKTPIKFTLIEHCRFLVGQLKIHKVALEVAVKENKELREKLNTKEEV